MFTLLRTILGDFDYMEIERANRILAPVFFLSYIFFVFFVLLVICLEVFKAVIKTFNYVLEYVFGNYQRYVC